MGENGGKWGKWGIIGGGRWNTYFLNHPSTKKSAKMGTNHGCRFPSAPRFAIMWLVWTRLTRLLAAYLTVAAHNGARVLPRAKL